MGRGYSAVCGACQTKVEVNEGSGMIAMPYHCDRCGKEWWFEFGSDGPFGKQADPPPCGCGGEFKLDAPPRCPSCHSTDLTRDPDGEEYLYD